MSEGDPRRYLRYLAVERQAARLYRGLAEITDGDRAEALRELADIEDQHAAHWTTLLERNGIPVPPDDGRVDGGDAALLARARALSLDAVLPDLEQAERDGAGMYDDEPDALPTMSRDERQHAATLAGLRTTSRGGPRRHRPSPPPHRPPVPVPC